MTEVGLGRTHSDALYRMHSEKWVKIIMPWISEGGRRRPGKSKKWWRHELDDIDYLVRGSARPKLV